MTGAVEEVEWYSQDSGYPSGGLLMTNEGTALGGGQSAADCAVLCKDHSQCRVWQWDGAACR